jgi:hypothetical protein
MHLGGAMKKTDNNVSEVAGSIDSATSIYEIKIEYKATKGYTTNLKFRQNLIKSLFFNVFKNDDNFWFLPEPGYFQIRFSESNKEAIIDHCNKKRLVFRDCQPYKDGSCDVKDHQQAFGKLMHECSVISLSKEYDPYALYERISHCVFLIFSYDFAEKIEMNEPMVLSRLAIDRSYTEGLFIGALHERYRK